MSYRDLASTLAARRAEIGGFRIVAGFDGFVDEMIQVVGERRGVGDFSPMRGIGDFAAWAAAAAGRSSLREIVIHRQDAGGCAVNLADGLATLGARVELFATVGSPPEHAFAPALERLAAVHPVGDVFGRTLALEFSDGKLMLPAVAQLAQLDAALAERDLSQGAFPAACGRAGLIAMTNWTLYPHMTAVWRLLGERVFSRMTHRPSFVIDLVDPSGRSREDIAAMLQMLPRLSASGFVSLALNLTEANVLARLLGLAGGSDDQDMAALAARLRLAIGVGEVAIHAVRFAACSGSAGEACVRGPYCAKPVKLTGAGDRFNAGYGLGLLLALPAEQRLRLGAATSGCFVRRGASADLDALIAACPSFDA
jgi:hypothetical protein